MQFYLFNISPKLHYENYSSHCSEHSQRHQQPVDAVVRPTFIWKLLKTARHFKIYNNTDLIKILYSLLNGAMLTGVTFKICVTFRCPV